MDSSATTTQGHSSSTSSDDTTLQSPSPPRSRISKLKFSSSSSSSHEEQEQEDSDYESREFNNGYIQAKETSPEESEEEESEEAKSSKQEEDEDSQLSDEKEEVSMEIENFQTQNGEEEMKEMLNLSGSMNVENVREIADKMLNDIRSYASKVMAEWEELVKVVKQAAADELYWAQQDARINMLPWTEIHDPYCTDKERIKQRALEFRAMSARLQLMQQYLNLCADALDAEADAMEVN